MAAGLFIVELIEAILTDTFVALVNPLLEGLPEVKREAAKPLKAQPWQFWDYEVF
jgi:ABC-type uncharacterized transport system permease subunit